ncbi:MAG: hypothetical protein HC924_10365 [Synechococcaceae cyanobacterium SM2_3_2]|nr:hypothetical protein [Synechococcaceae cyanobacterium SM2_3_2]
MSTQGSIGLHTIRSSWSRSSWRGLLIALCGLVLMMGLVSCGGSPSSSPAEGSPGLTRLQQVAVPTEIARLSTYLEQFSPSVQIIRPQADQVISGNRVEVSVTVKDYPLFKDPDLGLGPHLHVILDNQPYEAYYDTSQPLVFDHLALGSHTLRVFAGTPWHESFKNASAYDQVTFHVGAKTPEYVPDPDLPLLTYSRPKGGYGAEPILLDFWLANAPIRETLLADVPSDWQIRYTLNGQVGFLDQWQPLYLQGFQPGSNVMVVELVDGQGSPIRNVFNSAAREVIYTPGGQDALSLLVRGELKAEEALSIVQKPEPIPTPSPTPTPEPTPIPTPTPTPEPAPIATPKPRRTPKPKRTPPPNRRAVESPQPIPQTLTPEPSPEPTPTEAETPTLPLDPTPSPTPSPEPTARPISQYTPIPYIKPTPIPRITPAPFAQRSPSKTDRPGDWQWGSQILPSNLR